MSEIPSNPAGFARSGPDAVEDLVLRYHPLICKWANYAGQELASSEAEEVFAQVCCLFLSLEREFDPERKVPFLAYLSEKLPLRVRHWIRRERLRLRREVELPVTAEDGHPCGEPPLADLESDERFEKTLLRVWLDQALQILPGNQRRVMALHLAGHTEREIGDRLKLSHQRVNTLKREAIQRLAQLWDEPV